MIDLKSFSVKATKTILIVFNLLFVITGLLLLTFGLVIKSYYSQYEMFVDSRYFSASSLLISSGSIIFIIAFFGCCGALKENRCMVLTYGLLLILTIILEFASGVTGYALASRTSEFLEESLNKTLVQYGKDAEVTILWDGVQSQFRCCGLNNYTDWNTVFKNSSVPLSCCPIPYGALDSFKCSADLKNLFPDSCGNKFGYEIKEHAELMGGVAFAMIGAQFLGIFFSFYLAKAIKNTNYETV